MGSDSKQLKLMEFAKMYEDAPKGKALNKEEAGLYKSALQKLIRKSRLDEAVDVMNWMLRHGVSAKTICTRLVTMAAEDVGRIDVLEAVLLRCEAAIMVNEYDMSPQTFALFASAIEVLCTSQEKSRWTGDLWCFVMSEDYWSLNKIRERCASNTAMKDMSSWMRQQQTDDIETCRHIYASYKFATKGASENGRKDGRFWTTLRYAAVNKGEPGMKLAELGYRAAIFSGLNVPIHVLIGIAIARLPIDESMNRKAWENAWIRVKKPPPIPWYAADMHTRLGPAASHHVAATFREEPRKVLDMMFYLEGGVLEPAAPDAYHYADELLYPMWEERWWGTGVVERWQNIRGAIRDVIKKMMLDMGFNVTDDD